jgi:hypothetical protein
LNRRQSGHAAAAHPQALLIDPRKERPRSLRIKWLSRDNLANCRTGLIACFFFGTILRCSLGTE